MIKVYCGFPSTGTICDSHAYYMRVIQERYKDQVQLVYPTDNVHRMFHDFARNGIVEDFLASDCDILWMLDSDVAPQPHVLDLVTIHGDKWEAAGAAYPIFISQPNEEHQQVLFTAYADHPSTGGLAPVAHIPIDGTAWVDGLATGCMFLKRSLFEKLQKPYFEFKYHPETRCIVEGEDLGFCLKLKKMGIKFFTDYSMVCGHKKTVCLLKINNYARVYANKGIEAYANSIAEQMKKALAIQYERGYRDAVKAAAEQGLPKVTKGGLVLP